MTSPSGDDNDQDAYLLKDKCKDKDTKTQTKTNTKCFQDTMYAIFFITRGFQDLIYLFNIISCDDIDKDKGKDKDPSLYIIRGEYF